MKKKYLVSQDEILGQVVITCETNEVEIDTYKPTADQISAAIYLYRELPKRIEKVTQYIIKVFHHYEAGEHAYIEGWEGSNMLEMWKTFDKAEANDLFLQAVKFAQ